MYTGYHLFLLIEAWWSFGLYPQFCFAIWTFLVKSVIVFKDIGWSKCFGCLGEDFCFLLIRDRFSWCLSKLQKNDIWFWRWESGLYVKKIWKQGVDCCSFFPFFFIFFETCFPIFDIFTEVHLSTPIVSHCLRNLLFVIDRWTFPEWDECHSCEKRMHWKPTIWGLP